MKIFKYIESAVVCAYVLGFWHSHDTLYSSICMENRPFYPSSYSGIHHGIVWTSYTFEYNESISNTNKLLLNDANDCFVISLLIVRPHHQWAFVTLEQYTNKFYHNGKVKSQLHFWTLRILESENDAVISHITAKLCFG